MKGNFDDIIQSEVPVLVDFFAEWCQPCKVQSPILQELAREMGDKLRVIKIDVERNPKVAARYQVQGVPTLALFRAGQMRWRQSGLMQKTQLYSILQQYGQ